MSLAFRPGASSTTGFEISENSCFPLLEALSVHVPAGSARVIVAKHAHGIFNTHGFPRAKALARDAAPASLLRLALAGGALPPWCHSTIDLPTKSNVPRGSSGARHARHMLAGARAAD